MLNVTFNGAGQSLSKHEEVVLPLSLSSLLHVVGKKQPNIISEFLKYFKMYSFVKNNTWVTVLGKVWHYIPHLPNILKVIQPLWHHAVSPGCVSVCHDVVLRGERVVMFRLNYCVIQAPWSCLATGENWSCAHGNWRGVTKCSWGILTLKNFPWTLIWVVC